MSEFKPGDIVSRESYNSDVYFEIIDFVEEESGERRALLRGLDVRLYADAPDYDLKKVTYAQVKEFRKKFINNNNEQLDKIFKRRAGHAPGFLRGESADHSDYFSVSGKVLHLDGNKNYLGLCKEIYRQLEVDAIGIHVPEEKQPEQVIRLLKFYHPDVLVLTGHDGFIKGKKDFADLESYRNSKYFMEAVKRARRYRPNRDDLIIYAGACQSHYEALLKAGANYASSPKRIFIHAFDPVFIVEKICCTPSSVTVDINKIIDNTITGIDGIGGIETCGKQRWGFPRSPY